NMFVLGAASGGGVQWGTIIVTIATFAILILLLKKLACGPLKKVMDKRERDINKDIYDDEQAKLNAQKLEAKNKKTIKKTKKENNENNSEKERALADINNQVSELSVLIASKVLQKEISEKDQKELVEKYIKEAGDK